MLTMLMPSLSVAEEKRYLNNFSAAWPIMDSRKGKMPANACTVVDLGLMEYGQAWELQKELARRRVDGDTGDTLLLVEHPSVYTLGRRGREVDLLASARELEAMGVQVYWVDRGGSATYHGPGQLVAYPILDVGGWGGGPVRYVRALEAAVIESLGDFGILGRRTAGFPGVWVGEEQAPPEQAPPGRKIAAIGVRVSGGVTTHGLALNVAPDLGCFQAIVPCGISSMTVTSMVRELGRSVDMVEVQQSLVAALGRQLGMSMTPAKPGEWEVLTSTAAKGA